MGERPTGAAPGIAVVLVATSAVALFVGGLVALLVTSNVLLGGVLLAAGVGDALAAFVLWMKHRDPA